MPSSISSLKKHPLIPVLAILSSLFLLTGGIFNCCRINESLAGKFKEMFTVFGTAKIHPVAVSDEDNASRHPGCHGHGGTENPAVTPSTHFNLVGAKTILKPGGTCLSALSPASKAMASGEFPGMGLPVAAFLVGETVAPMAIHPVVKPRPHDKSSPPIYLTTLHLIV